MSAAMSFQPSTASFAAPPTVASTAPSTAPPAASPSATHYAAPSAAPSAARSTTLSAAISTASSAALSAAPAAALSIICRQRRLPSAALSVAPSSARLPLPLLRRHRQTRRQGAIRWLTGCAGSCVISDSRGCSVGRFVRRAGQSRCKLGSLRGHHLRRPPCLCGHACSHAAN